jgi:hypothetical protein
MPSMSRALRKWSSCSPTRKGESCRQPSRRSARRAATLFRQAVPSAVPITETARPHWMLIDEAHHMMPPEWAIATTLPQQLQGTAGHIRNIPLRAGPCRSCEVGHNASASMKGSASHSTVIFIAYSMEFLRRGQEDQLFVPAAGIVASSTNFRPPSSPTIVTTRSGDVRVFPQERT